MTCCVHVHEQADELNLLEDGLQLWLIALRNAPSSEAGSALLHLFPNLTAVMERSTGLQSSRPLPSAAHTCLGLSASLCLSVCPSTHQTARKSVPPAVHAPRHVFICPCIHPCMIHPFFQSCSGQDQILAVGASPRPVCSQQVCIVQCFVCCSAVIGTSQAVTGFTTVSGSCLLQLSLPCGTTKD